MKYILLIFSIIPVTGGFSHGQTKQDSLYTVWQNESKPDSSRVVAYEKYIWDRFLFSKPDTAFILAEGLLSFAEENNYPMAKALGYNIQGVSNRLQGINIQALKYHNQSLNIFEQLGDQLRVSQALGNIGLVYSGQGEYALALEYYSKSLSIRKQLDHEKGIARTMGNIGAIYAMKGFHDKALEYFTQSLSIYEQLGEKDNIPAALFNIGTIYSSQGVYAKALEYYTQSLAGQKKLDNPNQNQRANTLNAIGQAYLGQDSFVKALEYFNQSLAIHKKLDNQYGIAVTLYTIGNNFKAQEDYSVALEYYSKSLAIQKRLGNQRGEAKSLSIIGTTYQAQGNYFKALKYCQEGYELASNLGLLTAQQVGCQCLYDSYKALGKGNMALSYLEKLNAIKDSVNKQETAKKLQQMEFAKEVYADSIKQSEKERLIQEAHKNEVAKKNRTRNMLIGGGLLALLLAGGFYSRSRYIKKSRDVISKEKDRSENLLLNILPAEIAEELKAKGKADARDFDQVSILFTDFKEFTQLSEKLSAKDLVEEINHCFEAFDGICGKYAVEKIKTIGDSYMAAGGLPVPNEDSTKNTILAALEMADFVIKRKAEREAQGSIPFEMRAGIHTGNVVAGIVGVKKFQYDIWGDTVNTASRMESHGEVGKVNISQSTYELIKDDTQFSFDHRGKVSAKGKGEVDMYFVSLA